MMKVWLACLGCFVVFNFASGFWDTTMQFKDCSDQNWKILFSFLFFIFQSIVACCAFLFDIKERRGEEIVNYKKSDGVCFSFIFPIFLVSIFLTDFLVDYQAYKNIWRGGEILENTIVEENSFYADVSSVNEGKWLLRHLGYKNVSSGEIKSASGEIQVSGVIPNEEYKIKVFNLGMPVILFSYNMKKEINLTIPWGEIKEGGGGS